MTTTLTNKELLTKKIGVISLGCDKNRVDTENVIFTLTEYGFTLTSNIEEANIIIINTCAFLQSARNEALSTTNEALDYKKSGACEKVIVMGCLPQRFSLELKEELSNVDRLVKIKEYDNFVNIIRSLYKLPEINSEREKSLCPRVLTTPKNYAYLKIADGCNNRCSYCLIPSIRGGFKSRPIEELVEESKVLAGNGITELIVVAQDTSRYGIDLYKEPKLVELIKELSKIDGIKWIRIHYCYPEMVTDELLDEIVNNPKVCKYLDIPIQHINNRVLKDMARMSTGDKIKELIEKIRDKDNFIAIRTSLIVGFPGETEEEYNELIKFLKEYKLNYVGAFSFSNEKGTKAYSLPNQIEEDIKEQRRDNLMKIQSGIVKDINKKYVGTSQEVVVEDFSDSLNCYICRNQFNTPDVDTLVFVNSKKPLEIGTYINVKITEVLDYDLKGEIQ